MIHDAYNYEAYTKKILWELQHNMNEKFAKRALEIFYEAFGFPNHRRTDPARVGTIVTEDGNFRTEYKGEVRNGKEHGVGARTCYYNGKWCSYDECVWVDGVMCGYDSAKEMEFDMFEDKKIGFVVNDCLVGKTKVFASSGEEFDDIGKKLNIFGLEALAEDACDRPAPKSCEEIAGILSGLEPKGSLGSKAPAPEQKRAFELLNEISASPTPEEILFMAEVYCGKYHRIRRDGEQSSFCSEKAEEMYKRYYKLTGSLEVKYILDNFSDFKKLCLKSLGARQRKDDFDLHWKRNSSPSTSLDPDSSEWKS